MRILEYDEVDGQQVLELNLACFGWFLTPEQVKTIRRVDKRSPGYFAYYADENGKLLGQVGIVLVDTQTVNGLERISYIWGVSTRPTSARSGVARKLLSEAHSRLLADDVRISFLSTGKSLVAYDLYSKLGYGDFTDCNFGIKTCKHEKKATDVTFKSSSDEVTFFGLFKEYSKGLLGFVYRPKNFIQVRNSWTWMTMDVSGLFQENGRTIGYVLGNKRKEFLTIREVCCPRIEDVPRCVEALEKELRPQYMTFGWTPRDCIVRSYNQAGFTATGQEYSVFMVKDLSGKIDADEIKKLYGREEDRFQISGIDEY